MRSVPLERRQCKFTDEAGEASVFKKYSYNGCLFECLSNQAKVTNMSQRIIIWTSSKETSKYFIPKDECGCMPWKYASLGDVTDVCDVDGLLCFESIYQNSQTLFNCSCDADCNQIDYEFYMIKEEIKPEKICSSAEFGFLQNYFEKYQVRFRICQIDLLKELIKSYLL